MRIGGSRQFNIIHFWTIGFLCLGLLACDGSSNANYQGYVEGDARYLSSLYSGDLIHLFVSRGDQVKKGDLLFQLETNPQLLNLKSKQAELKQAQEIYRDLVKPKRQPEIESIKAQIEQVDAQLELAKIRVHRYKTLYSRDATNKDNVDAALARQEQLDYRKSELEANLVLAQMGSRSDQIGAQRAKVDALAAQVNNLKWQLGEKRIIAPKSGVILDTYYKEGELVGALRPVLSLLSPEDIQIQFFVPVTALPKLKLKQRIRFTCLGCDKTYDAKISYISPDAEYIPPLVYSRENSDKLVFRIKAVPQYPTILHPGQPVTITGILNE